MTNRNEPKPGSRREAGAKVVALTTVYDGAGKVMWRAGDPGRFTGYTEDGKMLVTMTAAEWSVSAYVLDDAVLPLADVPAVVAERDALRAEVDRLAAEVDRLAEALLDVSIDGWRNCWTHQFNAEPGEGSCGICTARAALGTDEDDADA